MCDVDELEVLVAFLLLRTVALAHFSALHEQTCKAPD